MTKPTYQQYHVDVPLTNISVAYNPGGYIADGIFPTVPVQRVSDKYFVYSKGDWLRREAKPRGPGARAARGGYALTTANYTTTEYAFATQVTDEQVRNSNDPLQPLSDGTQFVTRQLLAEKESVVAATALGASVWSGSTTPGVLWGVATSTPLEDIEAGFNSIVSSIGVMPNRAVTGYGLWTVLKNHPDIVDRIKGMASPTSPAIVSINAVAALIGVDQLLVGTQIENTGAEGGTDSMAYIWGKHLLLAYVAGGASLMTPSAGYVPTYLNRVIERYREDQEKADVVAGYLNFDVLATATDAGYIFRSAVA